MGNAINNCFNNYFNLLNCEERPQQEQKVLSYTDLPRIVKRQDKLKHKHYKHCNTPDGFCLQNRFKLNSNRSHTNSKRDRHSSKKLNNQHFESRSGGSNCSCQVEEYHRIISEDGQSEDDQLFISQIFDRGTLLDLPLDKLISQKELSEFTSNGHTSETSTLRYSPITSKRGEQSSLSINETDFPDFCSQCEHCSNQIQQVLEKTSQKTGNPQQDEVMTSINRQISAFFLQKKQKCGSDTTHSDSTKITHVHHTQNEHHSKFQQSEIAKRRKHLLQIKQKERMEGFLKRSEYNLTRKSMILKVSEVIQALISQFMEKILREYDQKQHHQEHDKQHLHQEVTEASLLFNESLYKRSKWTVDIASNGLPITAPVFIYNLEENLEKDERADKAPSVKRVQKFICKMLFYMKLSNEVCLLALIFIERLIVKKLFQLIFIQKKGRVQLLTFNWRPIIFTAILLAAKFWEDIIFWNVDFVESLQLYPLQAINQLESTFLALCNYELYVSEDLYYQYYDKIITKTDTNRLQQKSKINKKQYNL